MLTQESGNGGYIDFTYSTEDSIFNGLYTTNVTRCCNYCSRNYCKQAEWVTAEDHSSQGISNYLIIEVKLTFQTPSTIADETYKLEDAYSQCEETICNE